MFLLLEHAPGGELRKQLNKAVCFNEEQSATYLAQVACALEYCHAKNVIHHDIKPENLLLGNRGILKIADFGLSVQEESLHRETFCGTMEDLRRAS